MEVYNKIIHLLDTNNIPYRTLEHEPTLTSEASAKVRGEDISIGGKAIVMKVNKTFRLLVISAAKRLDSKAVKKHFKAKKTRFATAAELMKLTGLVSGSVPPFGEPILNLPLSVDVSIIENTKIAFNAGSLTNSVIMSVEDYLKIAQPEIFQFST